MPLPVRSGNPGLNDKTFSGLPRPMAAGDRMTLQGAINKSFLLLVVLLATAFYPWSQFAATGDASVVGPTTLRRPAKRLPRLPAMPFATPATMP